MLYLTSLLASSGKSFIEEANIYMYILELYSLDFYDFIMLFFRSPMFPVPTASPANCTESFYKSHDSISISWDEPDPSKVHGDLLQYIITARPAIMDLLDDSPDKVYPVHGAETSLVIDDLESNTLYNITVSAKNQYGAGKTTQIQASKLFCCVVLLQCLCIALGSSGSLPTNVG